MLPPVHVLIDMHVDWFETDTVYVRGYYIQYNYHVQLIMK